jgi:hypothetical protein
MHGSSSPPKKPPPSPGRTDYARATSGYDVEHERALRDAITEAIFEASKVTDCDAIVIRTGELTNALLTALASSIALSPSATRSPTALRHTIDELGKRLRARVACMASDPDFAAFKSRCFDNDREGGHG